MTPMTFRDVLFRVRPRVSSVLTAAMFILAASSASAQDATGGGAGHTPWFDGLEALLAPLAPPVER